MNISGHRNTVKTNVGIHFLGLYSSVKETKKKINPPIKRYAITAIIIQVISDPFSFSTPKYFAPPISARLCLGKTVESYGVSYYKSGGVQTMEQSMLHSFQVVLMSEIATKPYIIYYFVGISEILQINVKWYFSPLADRDICSTVPYKR